MDKISHLWVAKIHETTKKSDCNYWKRLKAKIGFDDLYKILAPWVVKIHFPDGSMDGGRPQRWSIFQGDGMVNVFLGHHCRQWFFNGFDKVGPSPLNVFWGSNH